MALKKIYESAYHDLKILAEIYLYLNGLWCAYIAETAERSVSTYQHNSV